MTDSKKQNPWHLTPRQCACLRAMRLYRTYKAAARALGLSPKTVDNYLDAARKRMGAANRKEALEIWALFKPRSSRPLRLTQAQRDQINAVLCFNLGRVLGRSA